MNSIVLFKNNLRINDNPILFYASKNSANILPVFIYDDKNFKKQLGSASRYWLHNSLISLNKSLNNKLHFARGNTILILKQLIKKYFIKSVYCEKAFLNEDIQLHKKLKEALTDLEVELICYNCTLLWNPKLVLKKDDTPYKVFTPYYKKGCLEKMKPDLPLGPPFNINFLNTDNSTKIKDLKLLDKYKWYSKMNATWDISESAASRILDLFLDRAVFNYKKGRDFPSMNYTSKLSPYIRFGLISVNRIWHCLNKLNQDKNIAHYKSELGWREFSYNLLYYFPHMESKNLQSKFDDFKWENSKEKFDLWKKGKTGYPIVDAAMTELWETGYMHNRMRMVTASFLVKNLLIDWRLGESWFWDCLFDADYASNIAGWQWTAGTGADAAPYFRIFNPILQGEKFDSNGDYTLKYLPQLKEIPIRYLQKPWESGIDIKNYVDPIVNIKDSRENALFKYSQIK